MLPCHAVPALRGRVTVRLDALIRNVYRCTTRLDIGRDCLRSQRAEQPVGGSSGSARGCSTHTESTGSSNGAPRSPVTIVDTVRSAERAARVLASLPPSAHTAVDTEVAQLDVKRQSPVGNGELTCVSMFSGPEIDFGNGPRLWVDVLDSEPVSTQQCRRHRLPHALTRCPWIAGNSGRISRVLPVRIEAEGVPQLRL